MKKTRNIMVQGTMSNAGKSVLCAALCRIFKQDGYKVAPFKSQNMALNSYITKDGLELSRAQVMQAEAAGIEPDIRMNPILLKPSSDTGSQVIIHGEVRGQMAAADYYEFKKGLMPAVRESYDALAEDYDIIVIEGAGSPAEINLRENDLVNMGLAEELDAPVLLAGDIDRGGVFAQLYGTAALLTESERARLEGFVINKFRGDVDILRPGLKQLEDLSGIPVLGVVPYMTLDIDDEDSLSPRLERKEADVKPLEVAVIRLPRLSNFTDLTPLESHPLIGVRYVDTAGDLKDPDLIILPGTKSTIADLIWMRESGLEAAILKRHASGTPVLGICGGYQMMGGELRDPEGTEGIIPEARGMGILPTSTVFTSAKTRTRVHAKAEALPFSGCEIDGYEIHMGKTTVNGSPFCRITERTGTEAADGSTGKEAPAGIVPHLDMDGCGTDHAWGTYLHGLFDSGEVTERLAAYLCERKGIPYESAAPVSRLEYVQHQYDILADGVRAALPMDKIYAIMDKYMR